MTPQMIKVLKKFVLDEKFVNEINNKNINDSWYKWFVRASLRHRYLTRNLKSLYLNMSWDGKELTLNRNNYTTIEWKGVFTIDELMILEEKFHISNDFILEPLIMWDDLKKKENEL